MRGRGNIRGRGGPGRVAPVAGRQALRTQLLANKPNSMKRLMRDLKELKEQEVPLVGVAAAPLDDSIYTWHGNLRAPADSIYAGGVFHVEMKFPKEYPDRAPNITLLGYQLDHPNVFGSKLCLDMLETSRSKNWYEGWNSAYTVESVLIQLQSFLLDKPKPKKGVSKEDAEEQYKAIVDQANAYKCPLCKHRGPIEPYPPFNDKESNLDNFIVIRDPKQMLADQMVCYHSKASLQDSTLGIGVSLSRLPRTGEIRSVTPQLDLLSLRSFTKQSIRRSIAGEKFTHWLPLYFGESEPFEKTTQIYNEKKKEYENRVEKINPKERAIHLLKKSMSFLTMKNTRKQFTAEMVVEVMPKLMITHLVNMVEGERTHISIQAIRRFFNFVRLFRLLIELQPDAEKIIDQKIKTFMEEPEKRVKDHCSSLGDILSFAIISNKYKIEDVLDAYLSEQLDRQAFWIIRQIPELDHTDEKYKGKEVVLEESRNEVCFKTGLTGFNITMICHSIDELLQTKYGGNLGKLSQDLDNNFGCLQEKTEDALQQKLKAMKKVDNFNKYYTWVNRSCPDAKALQLRLRDAISNSKMKRYHGSAEHMNILPTMKTQATDHLLADPSPFSHFDESKSSFTKGEKDPFWRDAVLRKFDWVKVFLKNHLVDDSAAVVAAEADRRELETTIPRIHQQQVLQAHHASLCHQKWQYESVIQDQSYADYNKATFTWRHLFHKLCFEQMIENLPLTEDFKLMYDYINKLGSQISVLRITQIDKRALKSNSYWLMAIVAKMPALKMLKLNRKSNNFGKEGWKFFIKGINYMNQNGRELEKFEMNNCDQIGEPLYAVLKLHPNLTVLKFTNLCLGSADAKAIGKVLADFKTIKELDLRRASLNATTTKDIADGLMRAKQLEIIKLGGNTSMGRSVSAIIYNLAFSPKIKFIDLEQMAGNDSETAEAIYKLVNISGSIEYLNLQNCPIVAVLTEDFYKAVGMSKTLTYLNMNLLPTQACNHFGLLGKAIGMNAKKNGNLKAVQMQNWLRNYSQTDAFLAAMQISEQQHEYWYGDKTAASKMEKNDVYDKPMYFALDQIDFSGEKTCLMNRAQFNLKHIQAMVKPEWPRLIHFAAKCKNTVTSWTRSTQSDKDMEILAHMVGENPIGKCGFASMNLSRCKLGKEGARMFAPALKANTSLLHLDISSCKLGVSGMYSFSKALTENKTLKSLNLYRNILDVDGARSIGKMLQVNKSLEFLDIGHNRIRETGLKAIIDGILLNKDCKLHQLSICANFINDDGINMLFERLVIGSKQQLTHVYIKKNFQSEYNKIQLATKVAEKKVQVFVDDFRSIDYLVKEKLEKSIWISPFAVTNSVPDLREIMKNQEIGFITDIRVARGHKAPGRPQENHFCLVEFQDSNSVNRSLQLASKGRAIFGGVKARIYRSGTQTAICMPQQKRR